MPNRASDKNLFISEYLCKSRVNILKGIYEIDPTKQDSFLFDRKMSLHLRQNSTDGMIHGLEMDGWNRTQR
jgi:hypothetical protein